MVHAAGESSPGNLPDRTRAVVLAVNDEQELLSLERKLQDKGLPHKAIREPDEPWSGQLMAIGLEPTSRTKVKKLLYSYKLFE